MILTNPVDLTPLLETAGIISEGDVLKFRREVFRDGLVSKLEADAIFMINDNTNMQCVQWHEFFVEALSDFTIEQVEPRGYVSFDNGEWLMRQISVDGKIKGATELELMIKTLEKATQCPPKFVNYILQQVAELVISGEGEVMRGQKLTKGVIGKIEAEIVRRVIYSASGQGNIAVSKEEVEILFDLNDQTIEAQNHPAWNDLFVKAVGAHLMAISGYQLPDQQTAFARSEWLNDTQIDVTASLKKSVSSFGTLFSNGNFKDAFKSDHGLMQEAWAEKNDAYEQGANIAEKIDHNEAQWLVERIGRDQIFHENEKMLIQFLKKRKPIHPSCTKTIIG